MHFRVPGENYEDIYWDDDYEEGESFKTWLNSKYCGPYSYEGVGEHYIPAQIEVDRFRKDWLAIQKKTTDQRTWNVYMEGQCEEMLCIDYNPEPIPVFIPSVIWLVRIRIFS